MGDCRAEVVDRAVSRLRKAVGEKKATILGLDLIGGAVTTTRRWTDREAALLEEGMRLVGRDFRWPACLSLFRVIQQTLPQSCPTLATGPYRPPTLADLLHQTPGISQPVLLGPQIEIARMMGGGLLIIDLRGYLYWISIVSLLLLRCRHPQQSARRHCDS